MRYTMYSFKDELVGFGTPFPDVSDESALRGFSYAIKSGNGLMSFRPSDYSLYILGHFDSESGEISSLPSPKFVASGSSVVGE